MQLWQMDVVDVKYLEWSPAGGLRHATLVPPLAKG
jgi:hypothetical protein